MQPSFEELLLRMLGVGRAAADVATQIIKVDVLPAGWAMIHQTNASLLTEKFMCIPAVMSQRLSAFTSHLSDNL